MTGFQAILKDHGLRSVRAYKRLKRKQLEHALEALHQLSFGCLYFPEGFRWCDQAETALQALKTAMTRKKWNWEGQANRRPMTTTHFKLARKLGGTLSSNRRRKQKCQQSHSFY